MCDGGPLGVRNRSNGVRVGREDFPKSTVGHLDRTTVGLPTTVSWSPSTRGKTPLTFGVYRVVFWSGSPSHLSTSLHPVCPTGRSRPPVAEHGQVGTRKQCFLKTTLVSRTRSRVKTPYGPSRYTYTGVSLHFPLDHTSLFEKNLNGE